MGRSENDAMEQGRSNYQDLPAWRTLESLTFHVRQGKSGNINGCSEDGEIVVAAGCRRNKRRHVRSWLSVSGPAGKLLDFQSPPARFQRNASRDIYFRSEALRSWYGVRNSTNRSVIGIRARD